MDLATSQWQRQIDAAATRLMERYPEEAERVKQAVDLAERYHRGVFRRSGEPFLLHPLTVAEILAEQGLSADSIIAGILHDVLEDTSCEAPEIEELFGAEVRALVEGVTKIVKLAPRGTPQREKLATYRKMILGAASDARVLVIKLADRLHNMRTISSMPSARQQAIAKETLEVYAPIAHRLGMAVIHEELEDRSFQVLDPRAWQEADLVRQERQGRGAAQLEKLMAQLREELEEADIEAEVTARIKSRYSIAQKLQRREPDSILDVLALRIITVTEDDCYRALGVTHRLWSPQFERFKDYIANPRSNLYRSLHTTVMSPQGRPLEVQIRTQTMHQIAEYGIAAHWLYKETLKSGGPVATRRFLEDMAHAQEGERSMQEAFERLQQDLFQEEIFVYTPKGDMRLLPAGSCAIDMAYAIHTELGHRCIGARINGVLKPITRPLRNGEVVEILTNPKSAPSRDWLEHVRTQRARYRIRQYHQATTERERIQQGIQALSQGLRKAGLAPLASKSRLAHAVMELGYPSLDQAALEAAQDESRVRNIIGRIIKGLASPPASREDPVAAHTPRQQELQSGEEYGVLVEGMGSVKLRMARCCNPQPGDKIVGYVSLARGVSIHRKDCSQIHPYRQQNSPRLITATWQGQAKESFRSTLKLVFLDSPRVLIDIAELLPRLGVDLMEINLVGNGRIARGTLVCMVHSAQQSEEVARELSQLEGALQVTR